MHFFKAVVLFAGAAAALPAVSESPKASAVAVANPSSSSKAAAAAASPSSSKAAAAAAASPSSSKAASAAAAASPSSSKAAVAAASPSSSKAAVAAASPSSSKPAAASPSASKAAVEAAVSPSKSAAVAAVSSSKAASASPSAAAAKVPSAAQVGYVKGNLTAFNSALTAVNTALTALQAGDKAASLAGDVTTAANKLQDKTVALLGMANSLNGYGQFATADSTAIVNLIVPSITSNLVTVYDAVKAKQPVYASLKVTSQVKDGLVGIATEVNQIGDALGPHFQAADVKTIQDKAPAVYNSATAAIAKYS